MKTVLIETATGAVDNVILLGDDAATYVPADGFSAMHVADDMPVSPGMLLVDGDFVPAPPPVPLSVTPLQIRRALRHAGLKATVDALIATLDDEIVEEWEYATVIERENGTLLGAAAAMGLTSGQVDDLFRLAVSL